MSERKIIRVRDVMKTEFDMVEGMDTVEAVLKNSKHPETKCFIVNIRHDDDEYGIVLLSDIAKLVLAKNKAPARVNVYEIMSKPVIHVDPEMDIRYCTRMFENFGLSRAPVVENKRVIGIVGYTDIVLDGVRDRLL
ncbi:MAG: CBS domain-containing protein [Gammaproteobacteria bacterium]|nr:MAG: CBS domain-containing protein [Gammaproteobacteria bacterium]UCH39164.1 MAG: CBS domain-containing protein [Gammaproteobacteria bacterium]